MGAVKDTPFASHAATACVAVDPSELRPEDRQRGQVDGGRSSNRRTSFGLNSVINAARRSFELRASNNKEEATSPDGLPPTMKRYYTQALWVDHEEGLHVAEAPPPGLAEAPIPPESEEDEHEYVEHVDLKAISLVGLREFVKSNNIPPTMTTQQVVRKYIIPATSGVRGGCAMADTSALARHVLPPLDSPGAAAARKALGGTSGMPPYTRMARARPITGLKRRAPYYYVVHAWCRPFLETVNMLESYFSGRPAEHTYVWLDIFAVPQNNPDHSGFIQEIQRAIWYGTSTLACLDAGGTILTRLWCVYEMFYTLICKQCAHALVALTPSPLSGPQRVALYNRLDAGKARCSVKEDRKKLNECVQGYTRRGMPAITNYLRSGLLLPPYDFSSIHLTFTETKAKFGCLGCQPPPPAPSAPLPSSSSLLSQGSLLTAPSAPLSDSALSPCCGKAAAGPGAHRSLRLVMGACNIPHPAKTKRGGEDAFFLSHGGHGRGALGVADGVGSWSCEGNGGNVVDPALYSRDLMRAAAQVIEASRGKIDARMALADAHLAVKHAGSCTAILGVMSPDDGCLKMVNMGDSGMRLIRDGRVAMATRTQSHAHNLPYQLACPDEPVCDTDSTVQGDVYSVRLEPGDIIIMATDGLYDNVWQDDMLDIVNKAVANAALSASMSVGGPGTPSPQGSADPHGVPGLNGAGSCSSGSPKVAVGDVRGVVTVSAPSGGSSDASASATDSETTTTTTNTATTATTLSKDMEDADEKKIGKHAPVAGDAGEVVRADASSQPVPPSILSSRAGRLARTLARTAAANMLRRDVRTPFAVELAQQPTTPAEFRANPRGGKPDDVTVVVAMVVEVLDEAALKALVASASSSQAGPTTSQLFAAISRLSSMPSGKLHSRHNSGAL